MSLFINSQASHEHSLTVLNQLQEYDDFMESITTLADIGCGSGLDLEWWATRKTRDENPKPLNIKCTGIDIFSNLPIAHQYDNIVYQSTNFEGTIHAPNKSKFDVLWCHDAFQYAINPVQTLNNWWHITSDGGMLVLMVPQTTNVYRNKLAFTQESGCYYHYSIANLIHVLAVNGWDCKNGFFLKNPLDPWLHAIVYKSQHEPMDPRTTTWHDLSALGLLPTSAEKSVYAHGELYQHELILPWLDQGLRDLGQL